MRISNMIIRASFASLLIYFVYKETGIATGIFAALLYIYSELLSKAIMQIANILKKLRK